MARRATGGRRDDGGASAGLDWFRRHAVAVATLVTGFVLALVFYYPVGTVLVEAVVVDGTATLSAFRDIAAGDFYHTLFARTAYQALLSTLASVAIGLPGAYVLARFEFPGRRTIRSLTILPFVLPAIMVAIGFVAMFGDRGVVNDVLGALGLPPISLLFTLKLIVLAHAFYNAPLITRVTTAAWESIDSRAVETARSLGAGPRRAFIDVVLPQLVPAILTGALLTFIFTFMSFPIILALGGLRLATVEVWIYAQAQQLNYTTAAALAAIETAISLSLTYVYLRYEARQADATRASHLQPRKRLLPDRWDPGTAVERLLIAGYGLVVLVLFLGPLASMLLASVTGPDGFTLRYYAFLVERQAAGASFQTKPLLAVWNSLLFGAGALLLALPMGVTIAVLTTRRAKGRKLVDALAMAPLAVSGVVVGLGLLRGLVFGIELGGYRLQVTGALAIVAAHAVGGYPFVVRNVAPQLARLDRGLVESARALGATRARALVDVELPLVAGGLAAGAAFAFAISVGEFDSTVILASGGRSYTMPVAVERYLGGRTLGPATAMGTLLLLVTSISFVIIDRVGGRWERG